MRDCISALKLEDNGKITWNTLIDKVRGIVSTKVGKKTSSKL